MFPYLKVVREFFFGGQQLIQEFCDIKSRTYIEKALDFFPMASRARICFSGFAVHDFFLGGGNIPTSSAPHPHKNNTPLLRIES